MQVTAVNTAEQVVAVAAVARAIWIDHIGGGYVMDDYRMELAIATPA